MQKEVFEGDSKKTPINEVYFKNLLNKSEGEFWDGYFDLKKWKDSDHKNALLHDYHIAKDIRFPLTFVSLY